MYTKAGIVFKYMYIYMYINTGCNLAYSTFLSLEKLYSNCQ